MAVYDKSCGRLHGEIREDPGGGAQAGVGVDWGVPCVPSRAVGVVTGRGFDHMDSTAFRFLACAL